jgi:hypothetical protein
MVTVARMIVMLPFSARQPLHGIREVTEGIVVIAQPHLFLRVGALAFADPGAF